MRLYTKNQNRFKTITFLKTLSRSVQQTLGLVVLFFAFAVWQQAQAQSAPVNTVPASITMNEDTRFNFTGGNTISVTDADGNLSSATLTVTNGNLFIGNLNGATISINDFGIDASRKTLTLSGTQAQINAALATLSYQGDANYNGSDQLTILSTDGGGLTDSDTVAITVNTVADKPRDGNELAHVMRNGTLTGNLLSNGNDPDGDSITISSYEIAGIAGTQAVGSAVTITGVGDITIAANGDYTFVPVAGYLGLVPTITYTVTDGTGPSSTNISSLDINVVNVDQRQGEFIIAAGTRLYTVDVASGNATLITAAPTTLSGVTMGTSIGSIASDYANKLIYYVPTGGSATKSILAYDWQNNQHIVVVADVATLGINATNFGWGGASFSAGKLYFATSGDPAVTGNGFGSHAIYGLTMAADGRSVLSTVRNTENVNQGWGDIQVSPDESYVLSASGAAVQYAIDGDGVFIDRARGTFGSTEAPFNPSNPFGNELAMDAAGNIYLFSDLGFQLYDPATNTVGSNTPFRINGVTTDFTGAFVRDGAGTTIPTGEIGDQVFLDANRNSLFDTGDTGIAGVTLELINDVNNNGVVDAGDAVLGTDTTDANGNYRFYGVVAGNYIVRVTDTGGVLAGLNYTTPGFASRADADITLIGQINQNVDFGLDAGPPINTLPTGVNDALVYTANVTRGPINVLVNDADPENHPLTIASATIDTNGDGTPEALTLGTPTAIADNLGNPIGTITLTEDGNVTFVPAAGYNGAVPVLTYTPFDGFDDGTEATVTFTHIAPPVIDLNGGGAGVDGGSAGTYKENLQTIRPFANATTISPSAGALFTTITIVIGNAQREDVLIDNFGIPAAQETRVYDELNNTITYTFTGLETLTTSSTAFFLRGGDGSLVFANNGDNLTESGTTRTFTITGTDTNGFTSAPAVSTMNITAVNDAPDLFTSLYRQQQRRQLRRRRGVSRVCFRHRPQCRSHPLL